MVKQGRWKMTRESKRKEVERLDPDFVLKYQPPSKLNCEYYARFINELVYSIQTYTDDYMCFQKLQNVSCLNLSNIVFYSFSNIMIKIIN